jgi:hypothetical protein
MEMKIFEDTFPPYDDLQILGILFTSYITPQTTLGNELSLKLLLGVCNTEERCDLSIFLLHLLTKFHNDHQKIKKHTITEASEIFSVIAFNPEPVQRDLLYNFVQMLAIATKCSKKS